mmetsp:Transcript_8666/g.26685  ORF Transcript_8666/g.26685 Transcript_8666/m.26685 type:complete len:281 (+) Transcript_8666:64-906(+)
MLHAPAPAAVALLGPLILAVTTSDHMARGMGMPEARPWGRSEDRPSLPGAAAATATATAAPHASGLIEATTGAPARAVPAAAAFTARTAAALLEKLHSQREGSGVAAQTSRRGFKLFMILIIVCIIVFPIVLVLMPPDRRPAIVQELLSTCGWPRPLTLPVGTKPIYGALKQSGRSSPVKKRVSFCDGPPSTRDLNSADVLAQVPSPYTQFRAAPPAEEQAPSPRVSAFTSPMPPSDTDLAGQGGRGRFPQRLPPLAERDTGAGPPPPGRPGSTSTIRVH